MVGRPRDILTDRHNLLVRVCADGIGHPDPDSLEWLHRIGVADDGDHAGDLVRRRGRPAHFAAKAGSADRGHASPRRTVSLV